MYSSCFYDWYNYLCRHLAESLQTVSELESDDEVSELSFSNCYNISTVNAFFPFEFMLYCYASDHFSKHNHLITNYIGPCNESIGFTEDEEILRYVIVLIVALIAVPSIQLHFPTLS